MIKKKTIKETKKFVHCDECEAELNEADEDYEDGVEKSEEGHYSMSGKIACVIPNKKGGVITLCRECILKIVAKHFE